MFPTDHIEQDSFEQLFVFDDDSPTKRQRFDEETSTETDSQLSQNLDINAGVINNVCSNPSSRTTTCTSSTSQNPMSNAMRSKNERIQKNTDRSHSSRITCLQCKHPSSKISTIIQKY